MVDLKSYFHDKYKGGEDFVENVILPIFGEDKYDDAYEEDVLENNPELTAMASTIGISQILRLGTINIPMNPTDVFDITVSSHVQMERNRVSIQSLVRRIMSTFSSAFMIFHYEDDTRWDWRFSFCSKLGNNQDSTDSKRYTFLLGPNQSCRTAADNFTKLAGKRGNIDLEDIVKAFDVEALSKEFFEKYKAQYEKFCNFVYENKNNPDFFGVEFTQWEDKIIRDYVKKLLGRIVFLHFLQKKGWLGVPADKPWGEGDRQFMKTLFDNATDEQKANYLDEVLEPLFADALDVDRKANDDLFDCGVEGFHKVKIPYLNGGLFERDKMDEPKSAFPKELFAELFDFFYQYNFTIDENDPNDAEVGVDPEMLGRIFENLLEDNKDKGAFYTPKEIVQYMCRESLIAYLQTEVEDESIKDALRQFVLTNDASCLNGAQSELAEKVDQMLQDVKICDPAIGSGAFPMGLMKELFLCRSAIEGFEGKKAADIKKHIIQNNIYGVDIEKGAVDIARLRFWLSLIIDEETPHALPNLDFKIMQGNSLLEQYKGVELGDVYNPTQRQLYIAFDEETAAKTLLQINIRDYFKAEIHDERGALLERINDAVRSLVKAKVLGNMSISRSIDSLDFKNNTEFFLWHTWFSEVFQNGGFNIVIGNPPYGAKFSAEEKKTYKSLYSTAKTVKGVQKGSTDSYTLFIEQGFNLLAKNGVITYIVPISFTSSDSLAGVHKLLMDKCGELRVSSYAVRPQPVFENAVVNTSIFLCQKTGKKCKKVFSTKMHRKGRDFNLQSLIDNLKFVEVSHQLQYGRIPKISDNVEKKILEKLVKSKDIASFTRSSGKDIYYRFAGGRYFKVITNYSNGSSAERTITFDNDVADAIACILSSSLSFWYYQIYSDNLNWKTREIESFRIPKLSASDIKWLTSKYQEYLTDIEKNANVRQTSGTSSYNVSVFKEYKIGRSKAIIDEIDDYIGPLYGLTPDEISYIKNYEIEFRLSDED